MKSYRIFFSIFLMLTTVFLVSCEDEPLDVGLDDGLPNLGMGTISFKVDGEYMEFNGAATHQEYMMEDEDGMMIEMKGWQIIAIEGEETIRMGIQLFPAEVETGSFDITGLGLDSAHIIQYFTSANEGTGEQEMYDAKSGRLRITDLNIDSGIGTMSGVFNAKLGLFTNEAVSIEITDGRINDIPVIIADDSDFDF